MKLFPVELYFLQLVFRICVAAVHCRPILHQCGVILCWSSVIMDCICLHLEIELRACARWRQWCGIFHCHWWTASIKPRLLFSSCRLCFLRIFHFLSWIKLCTCTTIWFRFTFKSTGSLSLVLLLTKIKVGCCAFHRDRLEYLNSLFDLTITKGCWMVAEKSCSGTHTSARSG